MVRSQLGTTFIDKVRPLNAECRRHRVYSRPNGGAATEGAEEDPDRAPHPQHDESGTGAHSIWERVLESTMRALMGKAHSANTIRARARRHSHPSLSHNHSHWRCGADDSGHVHLFGDAAAGVDYVDENTLRHDEHTRACCSRG